MNKLIITKFLLKK